MIGYVYIDGLVYLRITPLRDHLASCLPFPVFPPGAILEHLLLRSNFKVNRTIGLYNTYSIDFIRTLAPHREDVSRLFVVDTSDL